MTTKRFITRGKGPGRKVIPLSDWAGKAARAPVRAVNADKDVKDYTDYKTSKNYLMSMLKEKGDIAKSNWSMDNLAKDVRLTLGNLTDAGWYWSGRLKEMAGFLVRLVNSKVREEFVEAMRKNGVEYIKMRGVLLKSIDDGDGLYEMSGDNARWRSGDTMPEVDEELEFNDFEMDTGIRLTEEFKDKVRDLYYSRQTPGYDDVSKRYMPRYKEQMKEAVIDASSFDGLFAQISEVKKSFDYDMMEDLSETVNTRFRESMVQVAQEQAVRKAAGARAEAGSKVMADNAVVDKEVK